MKNSTKIYMTVIGLLTLLMQSPAVQSAIGTFLIAHPNVAAILAGVTSILALIHQPSNGGTNGSA